MNKTIEEAALPLGLRLPISMTLLVGNAMIMSSNGTYMQRLTRRSESARQIGVALIKSFAFVLLLLLPCLPLGYAAELSKEAADSFIAQLKALGEGRQRMKTVLEDMNFYKPEFWHVLRQALHSDDPAIQIGAIDGLMSAGLVGDEIFPDLKELIKSDNSAVRSFAAQALALISVARMKEVVTLLIEGLADKDSGVRQVAAFKLVEVGEPAKDAVEALKMALDDDGGETRFAASLALGAIGPAAKPAINALKNKLQDKNEYLRLIAARSILQIDPAEANALLPVLKKSVTSEYGPLRSYAAYTLAILGSNAKSAVPVLAQALKDSNNDTPVRLAVVSALLSIGVDAKEAVPQLALALKDPATDQQVRLIAAQTMQKIGPSAKDAVPALTEVLKNDRSPLRGAAIDALAQIKPDSNEAITALANVVQDKNAEILVREKAIEALGGMGRAAGGAVTALVKVSSDESEASVLQVLATAALLVVSANAAVDQLPGLIIALRKNPELVAGAANRLGEIGQGAKDAVPALLNAYTNNDAEIKARIQAGNALEKIRSSEEQIKNSLPKLRRLLDDANDDIAVQTAFLLGEAGYSSEAKPAIDRLRKTLKESPSDAVRAKSARMLGETGASGAIPDLIAALQDNELVVRREAAYALGALGADGLAALSALSDRVNHAEDKETQVRAASQSVMLLSRLRQRAGELSLRQLETVVTHLEKAKNVGNDVDSSRRAIFTVDIPDIASFWEIQLEKKKASRQTVWQRAQASAEKSKVVAIILLVVIVGPLLLGLWSLIYWLRPLWLLSIYNWSRFSKDTKLPWFDVTLGFIPTLFLLRPFVYLDRVLDAWVTENVAAVHTAVENKKTVEDRKVYIDVPVILDGELIADFAGTNLKRVFMRPRVCVLIVGEGGSGKTSLAYRIARSAMSNDETRRPLKHIMLPILIEAETDVAVDDRQPLTAGARGKLKELIGAEEAIPEELFERLARRRRVLVIVDHLSEMTEAAQKKIQPGHPDFAINALIVTSRTEASLESVSKTIIQPVRIRGGTELAKFMNDYLVQCGKRDLFSEEEFYRSCTGLSSMIGERGVTPLLATLYADQTISAKKRETVGELPKNVPELMRQYVNLLNRDLKKTEQKIENWVVQNDARIVAWECLRQTFQPRPAKRTAIIAALGGTQPENRLTYLESRLRLIETITPAEDQVRYTLDPLAEYMAGIHLIQSYKDDQQSWRDFLAVAKTRVAESKAVHGFIAALRDCLVIMGRQEKVPDFVERELATQMHA